MSVVGRLRSILGRGEKYPEAIWAAQAARYSQYRYYFEGDVFSEVLDPRDAESPLKYPLKINLVKALCLIHSAYLWGQWNEDVLRWRAEPVPYGREKPSQSAQDDAGRIEDALYETWRQNEHNTILDQAALDQAIDGGTYLRAVWDPLVPGVRIETILAEYCFPRWHPTRLSQLLEIFIAYQITREDARDLYGTEGKGGGDWALYWEHWTPRLFEMGIDSLAVREEANPYGFIPIEYVPRIRTGASFYGLSIPEDVLGLQNALNLRLADVGDGINIDVHPIRWIRNYRGKDKALLVDANAMWNLGQSVGGEEPAVGTLASGANYAAAMTYSDTLVALTQDVSHTPPVAQGRDEGSQRSGLTLALRMMPLVQQIKRTRLQWDPRLRALNAKILQLLSLYGDLGVDWDRARRHFVKNVFAPILPKSAQELIQEQIDLVNNNLRHPIRALELLGEEDPEETYQEILVHLEEMSSRGVTAQRTISTRRVVE